MSSCFDDVCAMMVAEIAAIDDEWIVQRRCGYWNTEFGDCCEGKLTNACYCSMY